MMTCKTTFRTIDGGRRLVELADPRSGFRAAICPEAGAELASLCCNANGRYVELLYRANDYRPFDGWPGRGPWLWPAVGRTFLPVEVDEILKTGKDPGAGNYGLAASPDRVFRMPCHGFAMSSPWDLADSGSDASGAWVRCALAASDTTRTFYPFDFRLDLLTRLEGRRLGFLLTVSAGRGNRSPMPFAVGNHFSFRVPFLKDSWEDVTFRTTASRRFLLTRASLLSGETTPVDLESGRPISDRMLHDTVLGGYADEPVSAELAEKDGLTVRITQRQTTDSDARADASQYFFVLYAEPANGLFCAEPWVGAPNALNEGAPVRLGPGQRWTWEVVVDVSG